MIKKLFTIPRLIILALFIIVAIMCVWLVLRAAIVKAMTENILALETQGFEIGHGGLSVTGFPLFVEARTQNVSVRAPTSTELGPMSNWSVKTEELDLYSTTLTPLSWTARHTGDLRVDMRAVLGERYMFDISPANIDTDIAVGLNGRLKKLHSRIGRARFTTVVGAVPPVLELEGMRVDLDVQDNDGHVDVLGKNIVLSDKVLGLVGEILGQRLERLSAKVRVEQWQTLEQEGVPGWMQSDARIISDEWVIEWGPADMIGEFDIGFKDGIPDGVIRIKVKKAETLLERMANAGLVQIAMVTQIKTFISRLDIDEDGRQSIELTIRDGVLRYGFLPLYQF